MKELLLVMVVVLGLIAIISRRHLDNSLEPDDDTNIQVTQDLTNPNQKSPDSLSYAITKLAVPPPSNTIVPALSRPNLFGGSGQAPTAASVASYVKQMQENPDQALFILEKGLSETDQPDALEQRLSLLQAASQGISGDEGQLKELALKEATSTVVRQSNDGASDAQNIETKRRIVGAAYKIYLNVAKEPELILSDTQRILDFQQDQATRDLIKYNCLSRFPELRERLMTK
jgi:hypothetical protein